MFAESPSIILPTAKNLYLKFRKPSTTFEILKRKLKKPKPPHSPKGPGGVSDFFYKTLKLHPRGGVPGFYGGL